MLETSKEYIIMIGSSKVAAGIYIVTIIQWVMKRSRTARGLIFDLIDATLFGACVLIAEAVWPQVFQYSGPVLVAAGMLLGKFGTRLTAQFWWRVEHLSIEANLAGVKIKSEGEDQ